MDAKLEQWFHRSLDYYHNSDSSKYNILDIITKSIGLFVNYAYEHCLRIDEYYGENKSYHYSYHLFKMDVEPGVRIELTIGKSSDRITQIMIDGYTADFKGTEGRVSESCSDAGVLEDDAALYLIKKDIRNIIQRILDNDDMNAYFLIQGIDVRDYLKYYE